jgi:hypothetical protein
MPIIDPETGLIHTGDSEPELKALSVPIERAPAQVGVLVQAALAGQLPRARQPLYYQPATLSPVHISMVFDRACGLSQVEICEKYNYQKHQVSRILSHPDAEYLLGAILAQMADNLTDPVQRLQAYAHEAINVKVNLLRTTANEGLKNKVASDILDRAGYGPQQNINVNTRREERLHLTAELTHRIAGAVDVVRRTASVDYKKYLVSAQAEGGTEDQSVGSDLQAALANPQSAAGGVDQPVVVRGALSGLDNHSASGASPGDSSLEPSPRNDDSCPRCGSFLAWSTGPGGSRIARCTNCHQRVA